MSQTEHCSPGDSLSESTETCSEEVGVREVRICDSGDEYLKSSVHLSRRVLPAMTNRHPS